MRATGRDVLDLPPDLFVLACDDFVAEDFERRYANTSKALERSKLDDEVDAYRARTDPKLPRSSLLLDLERPDTMRRPIIADTRTALEVLPDLLTWLVYGQGEPDWVVMGDPSMSNEALIEQMRRAFG